MSFLKKLWKNRESQYPSRRTMTRVDTGASMTYDVERAEGVVTQVGDDFSAESMNDLEDRIEDAFDNVTFDVDSSLSTTSENPVQNKVITTNLNTASTNATDALDMIRSTSLFPTGDAYSTSRSYSVGNLVIYNNALYRCKTACSAGSWSANRSNFESTTLAGEITDLNSALSGLDKSWKRGWDTSASEHFVLIQVTGAGYLTLYFPRIILTSTSKTIQVGSGSTTAGVAVGVSISTNACSAISCYVNGAVGTATLTIYSR